MENIDISNLVTQETDFIHQLKNVFRYKPGQIIHVFNEMMGEIEVEILNFTKKDMSFKFIRQIKTIDDIEHKKRHVTLYMSIIKNSNFDLIVEKATELGVSTIIPIITERTVKNNLNIERLNKIVKEATEQSGRLDLLKIENTISLDELIDSLNKIEGYKVFGSIEGKIDFDYNNAKLSEDISIVIGPEGGFTEGEISKLVENKITPICLNKNVLRAETAAIIFCCIYSL